MRQDFIAYHFYLSKFLIIKGKNSQPNNIKDGSKNESYVLLTDLNEQRVGAVGVNVYQTKISSDTILEIREYK